jgi:hypothetical protein
MPLTANAKAWLPDRTQMITDIVAKVADIL